MTNINSRVFLNSPLELFTTLMIMARTDSTALALTMIAAGYLAALCTTPPNPPPDQKHRHKTDRISPLIGSVATICRRLVVTVITYHAVLTLIPAYAPDRMTQICPQAQNLNHTLFSWSTTAITALLIIFLGAYVRLSAYGGLGRYFTFHLAAPDQLVTTGVYSWMQHPSYTGQFLIGVGCAVLFVRWDGAPACWIAAETLSRWDGWGFTAVVGFVAFSLVMLGTRVRDEEDMLRQKFGREWEEWHRETKRFVPGLL